MDAGCSTGCFIMVYMGGVADHSFNMPNPVALSSAEAEYNEGCMAPETTVYFDSTSAIAIGNS
jgi:hypothetical protein